MSDIEAAFARIRNSLKTLNDFSAKSGTLKSVASAFIAADEVRSAVALIYDRLYEANMAAGMIGRNPRHPIRRKANKRPEAKEIA